MSNELELLQRARQYDQEALTEIYDSLSPGLYRYAYRLLGDEDIAEDCVSDTFTKFLKTIKHGGGPKTHLKAYLYRIAHNWVTDKYRREPLPPLSLEPEMVGANGSSLSENLTQKQEAEKVRAAILRLTTDQRQVIYLKFFEHWRNAEIAEALDKPVGAVKSLQHRALGSLQRMLLEEKEWTREEKTKT